MTKVLVVAATDTMCRVLLKPWLNGLTEAGYEVHIACSRGRDFTALADLGFRMHDVRIRRTFNPLYHTRPLWKLFRLIRENHYDAVNTHSPVAAAIGRVSAWAARCKCVIYTVHGFYFHENMHPVPRALCITVEWIVGRLTDHFMFVSDEDRRTALRTGIARNEPGVTAILNGVELDLFSPGTDADREQRGQIPALRGRRVIGIVGRIVKEKGYREFLEMARAIVNLRENTAFLVVGDCLPSDRDQFGAAFRRQVQASGLQKHFFCTGFTTEVRRYLGMMDIFVLPSYREGLPRSILEAMACELPVVTTDIRGCREAVLDGATGIVVPPRDAKALTDAVLDLIDHPQKALKMGKEGRRRAVSRFDAKLVQKRFAGVFETMLARRGTALG
ncbi:MAG TPA: glycosyltransferase family 4 protein [Bryobacteraceae bacterium]|jgi:glycosyltransferase involved in cell wall biosynthesis|nr:glycosyltransferase family 4 protein [Bryobacteraceae bacterium]